MLKLLTILTALITAGGCCLDARRTFEETRVLRSGHYVCYKPIVNTNDAKNAYRDYRYFNCSYRQGPWAGSAIYPGTRMVLNMASFFSYSSAASGDYMMGPFVLAVYPIVLCGIPVQFCIDTLVLPYDIYNAPHPPEGYIER